MKRSLLVAALASLVLACDPAEACPPVRPDPPVPSGLPYGMQVDILDEYGMPLPTAFSSGRRYVLGEHGRRYTIRVTNPSSRRVEVVLSVDGLDVIDGKPASLAKRGYIINPHGELLVEGWRTSLQSVAAFRFGRVADSYAARTGSSRNVGVIGVAVFAEAQPRVQRPLIPRGEARDDGRWYGMRGSRSEEDASAREKKAAPSARAQAGTRAPEGAGGSVGGAQAEAAPPRAAQPAPPAKGKTAGEGSLGAPRGGSAGLADSERYRPTPTPDDRPGLGTEFGERRSSWVQFTSFVRQSSRPVGFLELRYNDERGLARLGIHFHGRTGIDDDLWQRETANPFPAGRGFATPPPRRPWE